MEIIKGNNSENIALKETLIGLVKIKIGLVPVIGSAINEFLFEIGGRVKQNRINEFVEVLSERVRAIEETKLNSEYLNSGDFFDITTKVFETATNIKQQQKHKALANLYIDAIRNKAVLDNSIYAMFANFISNLNSFQILLLNFINKNENQLSEIGTYEIFYGFFQNAHPENIIDKYEFKYYSNDLEIKALVSFGAGLEDFDSTSQIKVSEGHREPSVKLSTLGLKFIAYLNQGNSKI